MRLLSYNILDGGTGREDALARVVESQHPDVVALVEAEDERVVERFASRWKMDFVHAPGTSHASALLTRFPITSTINHALICVGLEKSLLEATVRDDHGCEITLGVVHLHARAYEADEAIREKEIAVVLDIFALHRSEKATHLLCGDFNANSPVQWIDPEKCKPKTREAWKANGGQIPRRVVQRILDAGYLDTLYAFDKNAGERQGTFTTEFPGQRVDYIFSFEIDVNRIQSVKIVTEPPAREASDHFPVFGVTA
jgi:endonuclease/exonuclease/phosphatase family metal-dependent hydrolase